MKHLLPSLMLLCIATFTFADDCNNPLLSTFGFGTGQLQSGSGLNYCKSLKNGNSCCSASIVSTIQDKATALASRLLTGVSLRDKAIVDGRNLLPQLQANVQKMTALTSTVISQMGQSDSPLMTVLAQIASQSGGDVSSIKTMLLQSISQIMMPLQGVVDTMLSNSNALQTDFKSYQKARTTCAIGLIKLQASAYCLACDPAYASKGVSGTSITMSDGVCSRLESACYQYISYSSTQGPLVAYQTTNTIVAAMISMYQKFINGDISGMDDAQTISDAQSAAADQAATLGPNYQPSGCTADGQCSWICTSLFKNGVVQETLAVIGGQQSQYSIPGGINTARRMLIEEGSAVQSKLQDKRRALQANEWNPDEDEAGVQVTFPDDPANVAGSGSDTSGSSGILMRISSICLVGFLAAIMV